MITSALQRLVIANRAGRLQTRWPGWTVLGWGAFYPDITREGFLAIPDQERAGHIGVVGTTRIGKTRLLEHLVSEDIRKGYSAVIFDPKGDLALFSRIVETAVETGRLGDLLFLSPVFSDYSIKVDPLSSYYMEEELVGHIVAGVTASGGSAEYFYKAAKELATLVVAGCLVLKVHLGEAPRLTFLDVMNRIGYDELRQLKETLEMIPGQTDLVERIARLLETDKEWFSKVTSSLRLALQELTFGATGKILGKASHNEVIDRLERGERIILYCATGSLLTREVSHIIGKVLISMFQSLAGRLFASGQSLQHPLCIHIDEGDTVLYEGIQDLFNKGGGARFWLAFYVQSFAQMDERIGGFAAKSIIDNINTWVYMRINHPETARHIESSAPPVKLYEPVVPLGGSPAVMRTEKRPLVQGHHVQDLSPRVFFLSCQNGWAKGITLTLPPPRLSVRFPPVPLGGFVQEASRL
ncbi:MAG: conjugal transfer protein TraG [Nitrospirae bacterium]|nr:MAG: conjugal transfer protein TraG [Nitrospirota bacterium]